MPSIEYKVCILAAGRGTRMGAYGKSLNKCLMPWRGTALLSHLIAKFPEGTSFVIALGHLADQVRHYVRLAHPDSKIEFVTVDPYQGPGSGPGHSLLACRPKLPGSFYFISCDTQWDGLPPAPSLISWAGAAPAPRESAVNYCNLELRENRVLSVIDKKDPGAVFTEAFVGLAYFAEPELFWPALEEGAQAAHPKESQLAPALQALADRGRLDAMPVDWIDLGSSELYESALKFEGGFDYSKPNESLYFTDGKVIKFFADPSITEKRCLRAKQNPGVFPPIVGRAGGFYSYSWQKGATLYEAFNEETYRDFTRWLPEKLWIPVQVDPRRFERACVSFYREKSSARIAECLKYCSPLESISLINGESVPPLARLAADIPWHELIQGAIPSFIHGDLQPDNILATAEGGFTLLDWRQDFGGETDFGDRYYDFAKMAGGLELLYGQIKRNDFSFEQKEGGITFRLPANPEQPRLRALWSEFISAQGGSMERVELLTALIFCNMAPLHHPPYRELLYALGRRKLYEQLRKRGIRG